VAADEPAPHTTVIEGRSGWRFLNLGELWRYRELLYFLTWRDIKVRYKQTYLGAAWAVVQPLATMAVFALFIGRAGGLASKIPNYPLFVFAGLLPWTFFANAIISAANSVVGSQALVTKIYFPRLMIPAGAVGAAIVDFLVGFAVLALMVAGFLLGGQPVTLGWRLLLLPVASLLLVVSALGIGTLLAGLTVAYRDIRVIIPFAVQIWMFATPTIYLRAEEMIPARWQPLLPLNPAYGLIYNFRAALLDRPFDLYAFAVSGAVGVFMLLLGAFCFRQAERTFADII
jgi:lipopolysaccharide transport system permease protein